MPAVSNSSPLILYSAVGWLDLLRALYEEIVVPPAVWREVVAGGCGRAGSTALQNVTWVSLRPLPDLPIPALPPLDPGEMEVVTLTLSLEPGSAVLLDDRRGRRAAMSLGLSVVGSGGLLVLAKDAGLIPAVGPLLSDLIDSGLFRDDATQREILALAAER